MKKIQINKIRCIFAASLAVVTAVFLNGCGILLEDRTFALSLSVDYKEGEYLVWYGISDLYDEVSEKEESGEVNEKSETGSKGISMEEARNKFLSSQENELDMGHLKALILGKGILENQIAYEGLLNHLEAQPAVASNVSVFFCNEIEALMKTERQQEIPLGVYLTKKPKNQSKKTVFPPVKLQELYRLWYNQKKQPSLPEIKILQEKIVVQNKPEK